MKNNLTISVKVERRRHPGVGLLFRGLMFAHALTGWDWFALAAIRCAVTFSVDREGQQ